MVEQTLLVYCYCSLGHACMTMQLECTPKGLGTQFIRASSSVGRTHRSKHTEHMQALKTCRYSHVLLDQHAQLISVPVPPVAVHLRG